MIDQLIDKIIEYNNPSVVGLDPRLDFIPNHIKEESYELYGKTPKGAAKAFLKFNYEIIDAIYDIVPAVKPQVAMYEQLGTEGFQTYLDTIRYAKQKGLIVIGDIKRSDIASTAEAYSNGHIGKVDVEEHAYTIFDEDFITVNPYLGFDSIDPYTKNCKEYDKGLFILVKTSNPKSGEIQDLEVNGEKLYERIGKLVAQWGADLMGEHNYSRFGAVVGATYPEQGRTLRKLLPYTFFLVPGYGAQGATAEDLAGCFREDGLGAIVNSSRGIIAAYTKGKYRKEFSEKEYMRAARQAALDMKADLIRVL